MHGGDWVELHRFGDERPIRRHPQVSAYWYAVGVIRQRHGLIGVEPLPPGVYLLDDGECALVIEVDAEGNYTFGYDAACPPTSEWAGTPPSQEPPGPG